MPRYRTTIEYDGSPFVGWQIQAAGRSVQGAITEALFKLTGETISVRGAGRTDAGVHARGQVAHFDLSRAWEPETIRDALNHHLRPEPVAIVDCRAAADDFDARFSATARHYLYRISNRRAPPALDARRVWWVARPLDGAAMAEAAAHLVGHHDFTTFRAAACQAKSPLKTLDSLTVEVSGGEIAVRASARSFLHNQVRSMVGSLKLVGDGHWVPADMQRALAARDRAACGPVAPAQGLYLMSVDYGEGSMLGASSERTEAPPVLPPNC
ncbi:MAG: tRNA pseudouridine(38-40) synthase TruA [Hyphomicrobiaceae bacterium]